MFDVLCQDSIRDFSMSRQVDLPAHKLTPNDNTPASREIIGKNGDSRPSAAPVAARASLRADRQNAARGAICRHHRPK
jgi:hypothetical protein